MQCISKSRLRPGYSTRDSMPFVFGLRSKCTSIAFELKLPIFITRSIIYVGRKQSDRCNSFNSPLSCQRQTEEINRNPSRESRLSAIRRGHRCRPIERSGSQGSNVCFLLDGIASFLPTYPDHPQSLFYVIAEHTIRATTAAEMQRSSSTIFEAIENVMH